MCDEYQLGLSHFDLACELDCGCFDSKSIIDSELKEIKKYDAEAASRAAQWFWNLDKERHGWVKEHI
jgi:hypothetical protein